MPVVSPSRYTSTSSNLTGSYRSTLTSSSSLDKPYYRSTSGTYVTSTLRSSYGDRTTEYKSRYSDVDGKTERKTSLVEYSRSSRAPSVTDSDSGISSRYRTDRSESRSRDISTTRSESSKADASRNSKRNFISSAALAMSTAELYNKYSPANYIPLTQRIQQQQQQNQSNYGEIARSKSISNDIGRPPAPDSYRAVRRARNSTAATITEKPEGRRSYKESSPTQGYSKRNSISNGIRDSNGNEVPTVSEIRRRFDPKMTVTKLPTNDSRLSAKTSVEQYLSQLKECENGSSGYTKAVSKEDQPVPVHLPYVEKNGLSHRWEIGSSSSRSNSNSDLSISKTISEPVSLAKPKIDNTNMSISFTAKLPSERLASIKCQLDPNNPIGKILEKSTVIQVSNGDIERKKLARCSPEVKVKESLKNDIEKQVKAPKHTSNFASYIQISQPIASGTSTPKISKQIDLNNINDELTQAELTIKPETKKSKVNLKYIDSELEDRLALEEVESPSGTGFENKTFEHENYLKKRSEKEVDEKEPEDGVKSMETSTESTISEPTEDSSPETPSSRRRILDIKDYEDIKAELAGGKSGPSGLRRSSERSDSAEPKTERQASHTSGLNGLRNIGNTCFMNSVLQCLSNTRPLLEYVSEDKHGQEINTTLSCMKGALIKAFASVIKELWRSGERDAVVNTTSLKSQVQRFAPRFMGYSQQDAQEFLRYLLEGLHEDVNRVTIKPKPILTEIDDNLSDSAKAAEAWSRYLRMEDSRVGDIFVGQLKSTLRCTHCNHDSVTFDPFWDLSLPIPSRTGNLKLQQCLQHFVREEELDGDEKPTCSKCGVRRKCLKWFTVQKFPQVLVLHLKRFSPTERFRGKLSVCVEFPLSGLDMSPFAACRSAQPVYNLYAVSNHSGTTYSGHYTAYCKHPYTGDWHEYNDSRVTPISPRNVVSPEAYVLFYELQRS
ncbi:PREDICTED: ubiquitin carboxyl-terminal hydrolase 2-like [Papilio xuthus]|uniref:Ubiquitin carboxyl-terminal hydrolase n=1 Tax=Papilio xuthus TaxID=66420 RepID=A0AAJ6ZP73_PAPXU|nr:PREDICTED: ubiquitin carboxyl-terminal hydrolase 2-like [Papilio xuthus]XP_013176657.1 PREDICTED: ubiquitin carboxyl-terminal hydrolase 2-like [Papilio xuthus]